MPTGRQGHAGRQGMAGQGRQGRQGGQGRLDRTRVGVVLAYVINCLVLAGI
jgi:hypothetical protein